MAHFFSLCNTYETTPLVFLTESCSVDDNGPEYGICDNDMIVSEFDDAYKNTSIQLPDQALSRSLSTQLIDT